MDSDVKLKAVRASYCAGRLTPFIGAGMSIGEDPASSLVCWEEFIANLTGDHKPLDTPRVVDAADERVVRANRTVARLRAQRSLANDIRAALGGVPGATDAPKQTMALVQLRWPLVVTTNYDDLYVTAVAQQIRTDRIWSFGKRRDDPERPVVLGRSLEDCHRVLRSLKAPDHPIVWHVQGFVGGQARGLNGYDCSANLEDQVVVGHAEYRRTTNAEPYFRRSFAEVFRSRSLLFLGSSVERYMLELFSEIIEIFGPSPYLHFAVFTDPEEPKLWREEVARTHGIIPIFLDGHGELATFIEQLPEAPAKPNAAGSTHGRPVQMASMWQGGGAQTPVLRIARAALPTEVDSGEWNAFSLGGRADNPELNMRGQATLGVATHQIKTLGWDDDWEDNGQLDDIVPIWHERTSSHVPRNVGVYARLSPAAQFADEVRPIRQRSTSTSPPDARDLRVIPYAVNALMNAAARHRISEVRTELLAGSPWRTFPVAFSFIQMVRGWVTWRQAFLRAGRTEPPRMTIHLDPTDIRSRDVLHELDAGRIELASLLNPDLFHFWVDIPVGPEERVQIPDTRAPGTPVWSAVEWLFPLSRESDDDWTVTVLPAPCSLWAPWPVRELREWEARHDGRAMDLQTFGVTPFGVLQINAPRYQLRNDAPR